MKVMIFGCGFSGAAIAREWIESGVTVCGTTRSAEKAAKLQCMGLKTFIFDGETISGDLADALRSVTHLVQSIAPGDAGDPLLRLLPPSLPEALPDLQWAAYLSTIGVYGDRGGAWVNETAEIYPQTSRSRARLEAEVAWQERGQAGAFPVAVLRLSGIYGPGRNAFVNLASGKARRLVKPNQVFNRIRVEDIAGATLHLAAQGRGGIFNVTDDLPAPPQDVIEEAARLMGVAPPPEQDFETAELTPMARSFYGENKRVSNALLKQTGYEFRFPTYRPSLAEMWNTQRWKG